MFLLRLKPNFYKVQLSGIKLTKIIDIKNPSVFKLRLLIIEEARLI